MTVQTKLWPAAASEVKVGGQSVIAIFGGESGAVITNPQAAADQNVYPSELLYYSLLSPATLVVGNGTFVLYPGETYTAPPSSAPIWVNAATSGHRFSAFFLAPPTQYPPTPITGPFPPTGPTTQTQVIPSYLYQEYNDDDDLQAFTNSYNALGQQFIDTINALNLPIYTGLSGALLDWVAQGLYGMARPYLSSGFIRQIGPYNTFAFDTLAFNQSSQVSNVSVQVTSDDIFKRILTWHFYKGDGKVFNVRWLKRRIMRFINGVNGTAPNVDQTYQVSVSFGLDYQVNITLIDKFVRLTGGVVYDMFQFNTFAFNQTTYSTTSVPPLDSTYLIEGMQNGVLELPFQFTYVITVG